MCSPGFVSVSVVVRMLTGSKLRRTLSGTYSSKGDLAFLGSHFRAKSKGSSSYAHRLIHILFKSNCGRKVPEFCSRYRTTICKGEYPLNAGVDT